MNRWPLFLGKCPWSSPFEQWLVQISIIYTVFKIKNYLKRDFQTLKSFQRTLYVNWGKIFVLFVDQNIETIFLDIVRIWHFHCFLIDFSIVYQSFYTIPTKTVIPRMSNLCKSQSKQIRQTDKINYPNHNEIIEIINWVLKILGP